MKLCIYLTIGVIILWIASNFAAFVNKKTDNGFLSAVAWFGSAYLLLELALIATKGM